MPIGTLYEDDIISYLIDCIDYVVEDCGIGAYEWGDGKYTDVDMRMVLAEQQILIQYNLDEDQVIYTTLRGSITDEWGEYETDWVATLCCVEWNQVHCTLDATYDIVEG